MKRITFYIGVGAVLLLAYSGLGLGQQTEHTKQQTVRKQDTLRTKAKTPGMMQMRQPMMGKGMMGNKPGMHGKMKGMMDDKQGKQCNMMAGNKMMGKMGGSNGMMGHMMKPGMMEQMGPLHKYMHVIHHLQQQSDKLSLTDAQINRLKTIQAEYQKNQVDRQADIKKKQIDLRLLLDKKASASDVRKLLQKVYDNKLNTDVAIYETAQKMLSVLTADQREKWEAQGSCKMGGSGMMMGKHGGKP